MKTVLRLICDTRGASAPEYAVILAIVGTGIALAALGLGNVVADSMNDAGTCVSTSGGTCLA